MLAKEGNLHEVFCDVSRNLDEAQRFAQQSGPFHAEIVPDTPARWTIVLTEPGRESQASGHLIGRGFGVYQPFKLDAVKVKGFERKIVRPIFPGYLFMFVWDVVRHWRRIHACPGVARVMMEAGRPVVVPDKVIDDIQVIEFKASGMLEPARRKRWRRRRHGESGPDALTISTKGYFADVDPDKRISALHTALGL